MPIKVEGYTYYRQSLVFDETSHAKIKEFGPEDIEPRVVRLTYNSSAICVVSKCVRLCIWVSSLPTQLEIADIECIHGSHIDPISGGTQSEIQIADGNHVLWGFQTVTLGSSQMFRLCGQIGCTIFRLRRRA